MAPRSSIEKNPALRAAVERLLAEGEHTIDDIHEAVAEYGVSRSAVGRYANRYRPMVETIIRDKAVRDAMRKHLPEGVDTGLVDIAIHRAQSEVLRAMDAIGDDEEPGSPDRIAKLVRALGGIIKAMRDKRAFEEEIRTSERSRAADAAAEAMKEAGAGEAQVDFIRRKILGMKDKAK
jgi:DNA-binding transcriptional ArsR family regulator